MKKSLEAELMSIAHRILQLKNKEDIHELKAITAVLYEKLSVLSYAEKHFAGAYPTIGLKEVKAEVNNAEEEKTEVLKVATDNVVEPEEDHARPDGTQHNTDGLIELNTDMIKNIVAEMPMEKIHAIKEQNARPDGLEYNEEGITEPNTEKIKDMVAQMMPEAMEVDEVMERINPKPQPVKEEKPEQQFGVSYDDLPQFERVTKKPAEPEVEEEPKEELGQPAEEEKIEPEPIVPKEQIPEAPKEQDLFENYKTPEFEPKEASIRNDLGGERKSLNDRLKKGINIGLNDRLAYIKHLFEGNAADYNRVLSQLNTIDTYAEANEFIQQQIKPDYHNWENKELYEARFLQAIENKYD